GPGTLARCAEPRAFPGSLGRSVRPADRAGPPRLVVTIRLQSGLGLAVRKIHRAPQDQAAPLGSRSHRCGPPIRGSLWTAGPNTASKDAGARSGHADIRSIAIHDPRRHRVPAADAGHDGCSRRRASRRARRVRRACDFRRRGSGKGAGSRRSGARAGDDARKPRLAAPISVILVRWAALPLRAVLPEIVHRLGTRGRSLFLRHEARRSGRSEGLRRRRTHSQDKVFVYQAEGFGKGSPSAFSNYFRYKLLAEKGGWWIDTDVVRL